MGLGAVSVGGAPAHAGIDRTYRYVGVNISIYDREDANMQIGTTLDNTRNLRPGNTWRFEANVLEDVSSLRYRIDEVDGRPAY